MNRTAFGITSLLTAGLLWIGQSIAADTLSGRVVGVHDGDTITVLVEQVQFRIRLSEIDAPESKQAFGNRSKQSLSGLCFGKHAKVISSGKDRYGRVLGRVDCAGVEANVEQVRRGMAWVFDRYAKPDSPLYRLQDEARQDGRGLWADTNPVPPWEWRRRPKP